MRRRRAPGVAQRAVVFDVVHRGARRGAARAARASSSSRNAAERDGCVATTATTTTTRATSRDRRTRTRTRTPSPRSSARWRGARARRSSATTAGRRRATGRPKDGADAAARVLEACGAHYTAWAFRMRCVEDALDAREAEAGTATLRDELAFAEAQTTKNPKNYQVWNHARTVLERADAVGRDG